MADIAKAVEEFMAQNPAPVNVEKFEEAKLDQIFANVIDVQPFKRKNPFVPEYRQVHVDNIPFFKLPEVVLAEKDLFSPEMIKKHLLNIHTQFCEKFKDVPWLYETLKERTYFAGGCIRDLRIVDTPKDYDLFFCDMIEAQNVLKYFEKEKNNLGYFEFSKNKNINYTFTYKQDLTLRYKTVMLQLITVNAGKPTDLIERFDFSFNTGYYWPHRNIIFVPEEIETKKIKVMKDTLFPVNAMIRLARFIKEGYTISNEEIIKLAIMIQQRPNLLDVKNLEKETFGLSTSYLADIL